MLNLFRKKDEPVCDLRKITANTVTGPEFSVLVHCVDPPPVNIDASFDDKFPQDGSNGRAFRVMFENGFFCAGTAGVIDLPEGAAPWLAHRDCMRVTAVRAVGPAAWLCTVRSLAGNVPFEAKCLEAPHSAYGPYRLEL